MENVSEAREIGPWSGPSEEEWVARINEGACRLAVEGSGGHWAIPWIVPVPISESELRAINGDR